jgi:alkylation response protein AidB-like acyl-CoA dehydrogenase
MQELKQRNIGGQYLIAPVSPTGIFTPEDFTDEHKMIAQLASDFVEQQVMPHNEAIEQQDFDIVVRLLKEAGKLGLLAHSIPEAYEGLGLDKITKCIVGEKIAKGGAYSVAHSNHTCIATLPITYFGTPEQKAKYLPKMASGEYIGAYCLTEPSSGSDALGARTTAYLNAAGTHYVLNGTKQFITNAGFADTFIVYAKVDGDAFTAFIVEKDFPGLSLGPEEKKMGIKGSSTRQVYFEDCLVPVENVLGKVGRGHVIAFNVLNLGRFNLGGATMGVAKYGLELTAKYVKERKQFGKPLAAFHATQEKLAMMAARIYANESLQYRTAGLLEEVLGGLYEETDEKRIFSALSEFALECSICKVFGSETLDLVADEGVQLHGGYGFIQEYKIEQMYRDSRINRIFEGTNEINRLLIPGMFGRKSVSGQLPVQEAIQEAVKALRQPPVLIEGPLGLEQEAVRFVRQLFLALYGLAYQTWQGKLEEEQETLMNLADIAIALYAMESAVLRTLKAVERSSAEAVALKSDLTTSYVAETLYEVEVAAKKILAHIASGDALQTYLQLVQSHISRFVFGDPVLRNRRIAQRILEAEAYCC